MSAVVSRCDTPLTTASTTSIKIRRRGCGRGIDSMYDANFAMPYLCLAMILRCDVDHRCLVVRHAAVLTRARQVQSICDEQDSDFPTLSS